MTSLDPHLGYISGNTKLTLGYSYFYDPTSTRAVCKFHRGA